MPNSREGNRPRPESWLALTMIAAGLGAWLKLLALYGALAKAEPKALRYRLLNVPTRLVHGVRRRRLRLPKTWPWVAQIVAAFARNAAIPPPA
ncbi:transposase [Tessaracoccus sp. MC1627]|uniref:transposase n=1 Tax=Tessaracoccus sp. MC1627 TaxID=2760312 RepID=UPI0016008AB9|nr:transposase [Tessaracoccus sp. MC1627]MBB1513764.1 transposase [Tessaracoccus sp. MC1627]